jgi:hypothetical protein
VVPSAMCRPSYSWTMSEIGHPNFAYDCWPRVNRNIAAYINSSASGGVANCKGQWVGHVMVIYATADIEAGDQLLMDYPLRG